MSDSKEQKDSVGGLGPLRGYLPISPIVVDEDHIAIDQARRDLPELSWRLTPFNIPEKIFVESTPSSCALAGVAERAWFGRSRLIPVLRIAAVPLHEFVIRRLEDLTMTMQRHGDGRQSELMRRFIDQLNGKSNRAYPNGRIGADDDPPHPRQFIVMRLGVQS